MQRNSRRRSIRCARPPSKTGESGHAHESSAADRDRAPTEIVSLGEGPHTTHFSVVDASGHAVASTYTLKQQLRLARHQQRRILLNDEMDDFTTRPGVPNALIGLIQSEAKAMRRGTGR